MSSSPLSLQEPLPIFVDNSVSLKKLAQLMGVNHSVLAEIVARDVRTIERDLASERVHKQLQPLIYTLKMLFELTGGHQAEIQRWLREPLIEWRGLSPLDCLCQGRLDAVVNLVERIYHADSAGY
ncbi:MAG: MbcA/ParS/Xre antitoxin family protein [Microcystaceae cyanobacterium]